MPEKEKKILKVHEDIASRYRRPYWRIEVRRSPKFPLDQYCIPIKNQIDTDELFKNDYIQLPCGYCKYKSPKLIWINEVLSNSGGWKQYEFKCERCGVYTFYEESVFS